MALALRRNLNLNLGLPQTPTAAAPAARSYPFTTGHLSEFEKLQVLGQGTEGIVYKVRHKLSGDVYALKVYNSSGNHRDNVFHEIDILSSLNSPYIIGFRGIYTDPNGDFGILMEFMDAGTLHNLVKTHGTFSEGVIANIASQVLMGLCYLHNRKKIVHCDIKPSNILVNQNMEVKIADFGVSKVMENSNLNVPQDNSYLGTTAYMSLEKFDSAEDGAGYVDCFAGDVWSLGLTLMEIYVGYHPYFPPGKQVHGNVFDLFCDIFFKEPPKLPEEASEDFRDFIRCCLQKDPSKRWTALELLCHPFLSNA